MTQRIGSPSFCVYQIQLLPNLFAHHHLQATIHHHNLVQLGVSHATFHYLRVGIAMGLGDGLLAQLFHPLVGILALGILQLDDVAVAHVLVDFQLGAEEEVHISLLAVLLGDRAVEAVERCHGQGEAVDKRFALQLVAL